MIVVAVFMYSAIKAILVRFAIGMSSHIYGELFIFLIALNCSRNPIGTAYVSPSN